MFGLFGNSIILLEGRQWEHSRARLRFFFEDFISVFRNGSSRIGYIEERSQQESPCTCGQMPRIFFSSSKERTPGALSIPRLNTDRFKNLATRSFFFGIWALVILPSICFISLGLIYRILLAALNSR